MKLPLEQGDLTKHVSYSGFTASKIKVWHFSKRCPLE